jgi:hypothetical protein
MEGIRQHLAVVLGCLGLSALLAACSGAEPVVGMTARSSSGDSGDAVSAGAVMTNPVRTPTGSLQTFSVTSKIDTDNPFFQSLGVNGRACSSCHQFDQAWTITPARVQQRFDATGGLDPIFRTVDGSNSPNADVSTVEARRGAYSMLLTKGLIRIGIGIAAGADFYLAAVDDPYGYASATQLSLFRRPLPATNLGFLTTVMWDGRETLSGSDNCNAADEGGKCFASIHFDLADQSNSATRDHAQAPMPITDAQREAIVAFESALYTAATFDDAAGELEVAGARGGPRNLSMQPFYYGINDNLGDYRTGAPFSPLVFNLYDAWAARSDGRNDARAAVARGEALFNTRPITVSGVAGLNGSAGSPFTPPLPESFVGACTTCHDLPNVGNHSIVAPLNIGLTEASRRTPDMPLYTLSCSATGAAAGRCTAGQTVQTTDPGRALISGRWGDIGKFKGPILRGLSGRAPYFHNGFAKDLDAVLNFYNDRFGMALTPEEHDDLVAFLRTL